MFKRIFILGALLVGTFNGYLSATQKFKIEDFVKQPSPREVQISPSGKYLSMVFHKKDGDVIGILDKTTRKPISAIRVRGVGKSVGKVYWVNNERILYTVTESYSWDKTRFDNGELIGVNADGTRHDMVFGYTSGEKQIGTNIKKRKNAYGHQRIIDFLSHDEKNILIAFYPWREKSNVWISNPNAIPVVYKLNVYSGKKRKVDTLPKPHAKAISDNRGDVRFSIGTNNSNEQVIFYKEDASKKWQKVRLENFEGKDINLLSFTGDNQKVYLSANVGSGTRALYVYNIKEQIAEQVFHDKTVDMSLFIKGFSGKQIVAVGTDLALPKYHYIDKTSPKAKLHKKLMKAFKGSDVILTSATDDGKQAIAFVYSDVNPGDYYLFESDTLNADYLVSKADHLDPELLAKTKTIEVVARDGKMIRGYLTLPKGKSKNLSLVVLPHGGPHGVRDFWGYNWEVQLLANQGYGVLQVNFRGSSGFGKAFEEAGYGNWGTTMQDDITDATLSIIEKGIADPKRVCIYGSSYGGYAALMGTIRNPDLYKCAIGGMGVYDLPMMFKEGDISERKSGLAYLSEVLGDNLQDQKDRSPAFNVDKIKAEILLIHGAKDSRAPITQVESLKRAFDKINKNYEWLLLSNEGHGYYDENNRLLVYKKIVDFLDKNIGS